jgi:CheY-like chemotaxis protein
VGAPLSGKRLLVVAENTELAELVAESAARLGADVDWRTSGRAALEAFGQRRADLVVLDLPLADVTASEILSVLRQRSTPAIAVSGVHRGPRAAEEATSLGAAAFFEKPFAIEGLMAAAARLVGADPAEPVDITEELPLAEIVAETAEEDLEEVAPGPAAPEAPPPDRAAAAAETEGDEPLRGPPEPEPPAGPPTPEGGDVPPERSPGDASPVAPGAAALSEREREAVADAAAPAGPETPPEAAAPPGEVAEAPEPLAVPEVPPAPQRAEAGREEAARRAATPVAEGGPEAAPTATPTPTPVPIELPARERGIPTPPPRPSASPPPLPAVPPPLPVRRRPAASTPTEIPTPASAGGTPPSSAIPTFDAPHDAHADDRSPDLAAHDGLAAPFPEPPRGRIRRAEAPPARRGDLSRTTVPRILVALHVAQATGALHLRRGEVRKTIAVERGTPVYAVSNVSAERLASVAVRRGVVTRERLDALRAGSPGARTAEILERAGLLDAGRRAELVAGQVRAIAWSTFEWREGSYEFELARPPSSRVDVALWMGDLVLQGITRTAPLARLRAELAPDVHLAPSPDPAFELYALKLGRGEARLLSLADGTKSVADLVRLSELPERETLAFLEACRVMRVLDEVERVLASTRRMGFM